MKRITAFLGSMAGRIFLISVVGAIVSATIALGLATAKHRFELRRVEIEHVTDRVQDFYTMVSNAPPSVAAELVQKGIPSFRPAAPAAVGNGPPTDLTPLLKQRLGRAAAPTATAELADPSFCIHVPMQAYRSLGARYFTYVDCWLVRLQLPNGPSMRLAYLERRDPRDEELPADPIYFLVLILGVGAIALRAARFAAAPLHALSEAATALGDDLDRSPLPEGGPSEVRSAARAFNSMQRVLRRHLQERHQMLASITHDLQTPLTRLRLRADKVEDAALRERMIADLASMQLLIREGLELARGDEAAEPAARIDLNSLLESMAADAVDAGFDVRVHEGARFAITARPQSLRRAVSNLIQNALKYAGSAELLVMQQGDALKIIVRDHGPGIPAAQLDAVLEPFVRLETSRSRETGGVGLGLTIARRLAERNGGSLELTNRAEGGLDAAISLPLQAVDQTPLNSTVSSIRLPAATPAEARRPAKSLPLLR
jgi:signal transduction histidine kinase